MLKIYRQGQNLGLMTDLQEERQFREQFATLMQEAMTKKELKAKDDLSLLLECFSNVVAKLRGYKSEVRVRTIIEAGVFVPDEDDLLVGISEREALEEQPV